MFKIIKNKVGNKTEYLTSSFKLLIAMLKNAAGIEELSASRGIKGLNAVSFITAGKSSSEKVISAIGNSPLKVTFLKWGNPHIVPPAGP